MARAEKRTGRRTKTNLLVGGVAGFGSYLFAAGGDSWGQGTVWQDLASTEAWPWFLVVGTIAVTAPRLLDAVFRATLAMVLMVLGYYLVGTGGLLDQGNRDALFGWGAVALTAVPLVAAGAYGIRRAVLLMFGPPAPPRGR
ncbi:hypothetical protein [Streptomyces yunnanensis]|uniref:Uncharacterized protein n=1 Tax=Streptomyces yunnanensis TaxID=156453 RepID=A0A9X8QST9_9ACTN|nr:hypothetical protein [Streptomyces yunnanensis]SHL84706.1 hypothetical protein SAMN05216268_106403 [Streptomyces yunnanensis]